VEYLCTTCCKRKRRAAVPLPALARYLSRRIRWVWRESRRVGKPMLILSGKFGLLAPHAKIRWYDHPLGHDEVAGMARRVTGQLARRHVTTMIFHARARSTPGWLPYYQVLEQACRRRGIKLQIKRLPDDSVAPPAGRRANQAARTSRPR